MPVPLRRLLASVVVVALAVGGGLFLFGGNDAAAPDAGPTTTPTSSPTPSEPPTPTRLVDVDTRTLAVPRSAFCDLVAPDSLEAALGAAPTQVRGYGNGESAPLTADVTDIAHEFACSWRAGKAQARAWLFAPPVTPRQARALGRDAAAEKGCAPIRDASPFGRRPVALVCETDRGLLASYRGLFGDAWLTCSLTGPAGQRVALLQRSDELCAAVALAAATPTD